MNINKTILSLFLYSYIFADASQQDFFDCTPTNEHISYLYCPGFGATESKMGRYCPSFTASTGEKVNWQSGGHIIGEPYTAVVFPEINLTKPQGFTLNPITAIVNKLRRDLFPFVQRLMQDKLHFEVEDNNKSKESVINYTLDLSQANLGQKKDIKRLHKTLLQHNKKYPNTGVILFGDSRGAATIFNYIAQYKPKNVKAAIMDGIYDYTKHCIKHFIYSDKDGAAEDALHNLLSFFLGSYSKKGPFCKDLACKMTDDIPLLFVISLKDGLTPAQGAFNLYAKLRQAGLKKVHLLVLKKALHPFYMIDNPEDTQLYETVVHAFYKHYNLPHNCKKAQMGQKEFEKTQPTIDQLKEYNLPTCNLCTFNN